MEQWGGGSIWESKNAMSSTPTLAMPNFHETFIMETDASGEWIGAVLQHQGRLIAYMSHALGTSKKAWSIYNKECRANFIELASARIFCRID